MNKLVTHVAVGVTALGLGGVAGYFIGKKRANKKADAKINEITEYWQERIAEYEGPAAIITSGEPLQVGDEITLTKADGTPDTVVVEGLLVGANAELATESAPMYPDAASELEDEDPAVIFPPEPEAEQELPPDFPEAPVVVVDDFTVEGQNPSPDARAFVEQFKDRPLAAFTAGVTYPGQEDDDEETPVSSVPDFVTVRDPQGPYVISIDEYMDPQTDPPFTKVEMRFFRGDSVVVDARDDQVPMSTVGRKNTERFGEGTTDPRQVYIRNERLSIDIELTLEDGLYLHEVAGQDFPDKTPVLKMRQGDDS